MSLLSELKYKPHRSSRHGSAVTNLTSILVGMRVWSFVLLSGLSIWRCHELWCRSRMWLRSCIAMAMVWASSCNSDLTSSLGTSICCTWSPEKQKQNKTKQKTNKQKNPTKQKNNKSQKAKKKKKPTSHRLGKGIYNLVEGLVQNI